MTALSTKTMMSQLLVLVQVQVLVAILVLVAMLGLGLGLGPLQVAIVAAIQTNIRHTLQRPRLVSRQPILRTRGTVGLLPPTMGCLLASWMASGRMPWRRLITTPRHHPNSTTRRALVVVSGHQTSASL